MIIQMEGLPSNTRHVAITFISFKNANSNCDNSKGEISSSTSSSGSGALWIYNNALEIQGNI